MTGGPSISVRPATVSDAQALLSLSNRILAQPGNFHLLQAHENVQSEKEQSELIGFYLKKPNRCILVAENSKKEIIGQVTAFGGTYEADKGTAVVIIEVDHSHRRQGIGTLLLQELEKWARQNGLHRLELSVLPENRAAIGLYEKNGYAIEGKKRSSRRSAGRFYDELIMAKLLP